MSKAEKVKLLAERLSECPQVTRFDKEGNVEAWTLAQAFADLEESFSRFLDEQLPKLLERPLSDEDLNILLLEIGEEFRHVLYHVHAPDFYKFLGARDGEVHSAT